MLKMQWERDDDLFIFVSATRRRSWAMAKIARTSLTPRTST
jgi:hypothetical protein